MSQFEIVEWVCDEAIVEYTSRGCNRRYVIVESLGPLQSDGWRVSSRASGCMWYQGRSLEEVARYQAGGASYASRASARRGIRRYAIEVRS